jgi:glycogen synthase
VAGQAPGVNGPLRILHLTSGYHPDRPAGIQRYQFELGRALAARGHDFHLLDCRPGGADDDFVDEGVQVHRRGTTKVELHGLEGLPLLEGGLYQAVAHRLETDRLGIRFDVIESPELRACGLLLATAAEQAVVARVHTPVSIQAPFYPQASSRDVGLADELERGLSRLASLVTIATHSLAERLKASGWLGDGPVRVIRNPFELSFWSQAPPVETTGPVVLSAGRLSARKAPELLIRAGARLTGRVAGLQVMFLGPSPGSDSGGEAAARLAQELAVRCRFVEPVPRQDLPSVFGQARVLAVPSWQEGFSNAALEAMAAGRPVVCTSSAGIAELIRGTGAGEVVPPGDDAALAEALEPFLRSAEYAAAAGARAKQLAQAQGDSRVIAAQVEDAYREAIARHREANRTSV